MPAGLVSNTWWPRRGRADVTSGKKGEGNLSISLCMLHLSWRISENSSHQVLYILRLYLQTFMSWACYLPSLHLSTLYCLCGNTDQSPLLYALWLICIGEWRTQTKRFIKVFGFCVGLLLWNINFLNHKNWPWLLQVTWGKAMARSACWRPPHVSKVSSVTILKMLSSEEW